MVWNTPATWVAGTVLTAAQLNAQARDNLKAIGDAWTSYTPAWTSSGTAPAIGNGAIIGKYVAAGKLIHFRAIITMGSTTTYGTGQYSISLPTTVHATGLQAVSGEALIAGSAYRLHVRLPAGGTTALLYCDPTTAGNAVRSVTNLVPATFANTHYIVVNGTYEGA